MKVHLLVVPLVAAFLAACGGSSSGTGTLRVSMTDSPACGFDAVNVTVEKVRFHRSASASENDSGWSEIVLASPKRLDLLALTNGVLAELGETPLPAGKYTQMRLVLAENDGSSPPANSVVPTGGTETALDTPSALQSGLKMNVNIDVPADKVVDAVIDFDACKSVVARANSKQFNLKPVLTVTPLLSDAGQRVVGHVAPDIVGAYTNVSLQLNGVPVKSTVPDAAGRFVLYPVPVGTYDLVVTAPGRATAVMTAVPVVDTAVTTTNPDTAPIDPPVSAVQREAAGSSNALDATVRALQSFSGGPKVEVASTAVNVTTGAYAFTLPAAAPAKVAYADGATSLTLAAEDAAAGKYQLEASAPGRTTQTKDIDVSAADATADFVFP